MRHVLRALAPDHAVDVLCVRHGDQPYVERHGTARILRVPLHDDDRRAQVQAFRRAALRQLEGAEYDVVHVRDGWAGMPVLEARERLHYAVVFDATRAPMAEARAGQADLEAELARDEDALLIAADIVLVPHEPARRHIAARGGHERVHLVRAGVDVDQFDYDDLPVTGPPRILYLGGLAPGRGVRILVRAMVEVARRTTARLVIAGPSAPGFDQTLVAAVRDMGLDDRVDILGRVDHEMVPTLIASSEICVAPAAADLGPRPTALYPTKMLEYMACRRAVVAPRMATVTLLAQEGVHADLFMPGDPTSLAGRLVALLEDPARREALAEAGYQMVRGRCTASGTRRQLRVAYRALASHPRWAERLAATGAAAGVGPPPVAVMGVDPVTTELSDQDLFDGANPVTEIDRPGVPDVDHTRVDVAADWIDAGAELALEDAGGDQWVVDETGARHHGVPWADDGYDDHDDGTPVDVLAVPPSTPPLESRFVAGEVDVPTPVPELDTDDLFTAVSVLLGSTPGPGVDDVDEEAPTPAPIRGPGPGLPPHLRGDDQNG